MRRDEGFPIADISTALLDDPKIRALWRGLRDRPRMCEAVTVYLSVLLTSWGEGERRTVEEAVPVWLEPESSLTSALQDAGLLDAETRIPEHAWAAWYEPAFTRREKRRASGALGGARGHGSRTREEAVEVLTRLRNSNAAASLQESGSTADSEAAPDRPSVLPSVLPSVRPDQASYTDSVVAAMQARLARKRGA